MNKLPLISVIVPIYNAEIYLVRCFNSLANQTYRNLEIILVDDGSLDNSLEICKKYVKNYNQFKLIHQINQGRVKARKEGVKLASGDFISFVDADDWIDKDMYEKLVVLLKKDTDMVAFGLIEEYPKYIVSKKNSLTNGIYNEQEIKSLYNKLICNDTFFEWGILPHLCDKLIKKGLLMEAGFFDIDENITYGEDLLATFQCCLFAKMLVITDITPYHYVQINYINGLQRINVKTLSVCNLYKGLKNSVIQKFDNETLNKQIKLYIWFILLINNLTEINEREKYLLIPFNKVKASDKVIIYGAGGFGIAIYKYLTETSPNSIAGWVDQNYNMPEKKCLGIKSINSIKDIVYDYILIAILNEKLAENIMESLMKMGIEQRKIYYITMKMIEDEKLPKWLIEGEKNG